MTPARRRRPRPASDEPAPDQPARHNRRGHRRRAALRAGTAVAGVLVLAGCSLLPSGSSSSGPATGTAEAAVVGDVPAALESFYTQKVSWHPCEASFECTTVTVPMDYDHPGEQSLELALIKRPADGNAQSSVLINPGGPGGSGYDTVLQSSDAVTTKRLREHFNLVGFDPRGVKRSAPVTCLTDKQRDAHRAEDFDPDTAAGLAKAKASAKKLAAACKAKTGPKLGFVDTNSAARDMDILRAALGETKLDYLGFSYGTFLGATYAGLFPDRVGKLVLDGAIDPSLSNAEITLGQAKGFENALLAYVKDCQSGQDCPVSGTPQEGVRQIAKLIRSVQDSPMTAQDGRTVTVGLFVSGLIVPLYNSDNWPVLSRALTSAFNGDPSQMLLLADLSADREQNGHYSSNGNLAFLAINCLDYPMDAKLAAMRAEEKQLEAASPTLGHYLAYGALGCQPWPYKPVRKPAPIHAAGADPIVVIGTTGDPATPYPWAQALAKELDSGTLVTWQGQGHTAYGRSNSCVAGAVDDYFIDGTVPKDGTRC